METAAVVLTGPKNLKVESVRMKTPEPNETIVDVLYSGISTGTEKLFWSGEMPPFPGMGYPLVPGYESVGEVTETHKNSGFKSGDMVFVPGSNCFEGVRGLFGGSAKSVSTPSDRLIKIEKSLAESGTLFALAATARHAIAGMSSTLPDLIVGHGVLGRLLARLTIVAGGKPPTVWEIDKTRQGGAEGYPVLHPNEDQKKDYGSIYEASGDAMLLDSLIGRIRKGGEIVLTGFYSQNINFAFPAAFMKEMRMRVAAEFNSDDIRSTRALIEAGSLSLDNLITHRRSANTAEEAYHTAFSDNKCLKMILDWSSVQ